MQQDDPDFEVVNWRKPQDDDSVTLLEQALIDTAKNGTAVKIDVGNVGTPEGLRDSVTVADRLEHYASRHGFMAQVIVSGNALYAWAEKKG